MKTWLYHYDVFPRILPVGREVCVTVKPLGRHAAFDAHANYHFEILPLLHRNMVVVEDNGLPIKVPALYADGCLSFCYAFPGEQEHFLYLYKENQLIEKFSVYSVEDDLLERLPLLGDLHVHSIYSDGRQAPEIVVADYRRRGYDFTTLTDHHNYAGSLAAIQAYRNIPLDLTIVPGEEVHLPDNDIHIVNFGAEHSVNFLLKSSFPYAEACGISTETAPKDEWCCLPGTEMPEAISDEEYRLQVEALLEGKNIPEGIDRKAYGGCLWICKKIREAGGLSIFAHPYWIRHAYHVPEAMNHLLFESHCFDCFEVLGGERYLEQNELQTWLYVEEKLKGNSLPVVGNSDSHNLFNDPDSADAATIVFSPANERKALVKSVQDGWSVAVDLISKEKRLVGELRLVRYARFLLEYFFPLQEELCFEEGRLMRAYVCKTDPKAAEKLKVLQGQTARLRSHLFAQAQ